METTLQLVKAELGLYSFHEETLPALEQPEQLAHSEVTIPVAISQLGEGWLAEEALAIGVYSVLVSSSLEDALIIAVNRSGDSDSTCSSPRVIWPCLPMTRG
ncbi:ADP-ribosylglycohydrolase family protein [Thalassotalea sp. G20_0]|uniref:ADP-ribosylglycohydrolase family protein n=1 Tax=Thalassotalea sp. G20_0 TaxID=2821093 RepID=UPI001ADAB887|nr:ADP-ribosylglycohydrolase family protein [Thalassotalea sp. G20_0]MBO9496246.1 ADP-ribosylglycohydrolase family protein [Thalassotalea sp. G20_0]